MFCIEPLDDAVLIYLVFLVFFLLLFLLLPFLLLPPPLPPTVVLQLGSGVPTPAMLRRINIF